MLPKHSSFTVEFNGIASVLHTLIHIAPAFNPENPPNPPLPYNEFVAIWDTGATNTVITEEVVKKCNLKPIRFAKVHTASGENICPVFKVNIGLPNKVGFCDVTVTQGKLSGDANALIGMDIIGSGDFAVTNKDGKTVFTYRYPSIDRIDFVKETNKQKNAINSSIGRNAPCPCGSGKKYKKCCGKKAA